MKRGIGINKPNQYAVISFGFTAKVPMQIVKVENRKLYEISSVTQAIESLEERQTDKPDGFHGILRAVKDLPLPKTREYITSLLLVTDEPRIITYAGRKITKNRTNRVLGNRLVVFSSLLKLEYHFTVDVRKSKEQVFLGYDALLIDYAGMASVAVKDGKYLKKNYKYYQPRVHVHREKCEMFADYGELALKHHGFVGDFSAATKNNGIDESLREAVAMTMANSVYTFNVCERCRCEDEESGSEEPSCIQPHDRYWCWCRFRQEKVSKILMYTMGLAM